MGRPGVEHHTGVGLLLASDDTIPVEFDHELRKVIREARGDDPVISIFALRSAYPPPERHDPE